MIVDKKFEIKWTGGHFMPHEFVRSWWSRNSSTRKTGTRKNPKLRFVVLF